MGRKLAARLGKYRPTVTLGLLLTATVSGAFFFLSYPHFRAVRSLLQTEEGIEVSGVISEYKPSLGGKGAANHESFMIGDVKFDYSDDLMPGFGVKKYMGGPIRDGLPVRVIYVPYQNLNLIVRLEIARS